MDNSEKPIIFIDSSFLRGIKLTDPNFEKLLHHSRNNKIMLYMSEIVYEEWRTEDTIRMRKRNNKEQTIKNESLIAREISSEPLDYVELEKISDKKYNEFINYNKIKIILVKDEHLRKAKIDYFKGNPPFKNIKNRSDIPDAWIYHAAIDLYNEHKLVYLLCRDEKKDDKHFFKVLEELGLLPKKLSDMLTIIEQPPSAPDENIKDNYSLKEFTENFIDSELLVRILGYIKWFDPISKKELFNLLESKGYLVQQVRNIVESLVLKGVLKDTGNFYIPLREELFQQAANSIIHEILGQLDLTERRDI